MPPLFSPVVDVPSGYVKIAIENGPVEIVDDYPLKMVTFHSFLYVYHSYGHLSVISTYNPIYRMYNPIYNQL